MMALSASSAIIIFIYFTLLFAIACRLHNYAIADIGWGAGFILTALYCTAAAPQYSSLQILTFCLVVIWGTRLSIYIYLRNRNKPEDFRYRQFREKWGRNANLHAYIKLYLTQAAIMWLVSFAIYIAAAADVTELSWPALFFSGIAFCGFLYESISDYQLARFKSESASHGKIMMSGLWRFSRHPNYFGEIVFWWGISLLVATSSSQYLALISGLTMNLLIVYVSGVPMLEGKYKNNPDYLSYIAHTNSILPWRRTKSV